MTREPPLNWVGVTFASSAPWAVSKTSLATFSPSWTKAAPMTVSDGRDEVEEAVARGDERCRAATGTIVAERNGRRVARRARQPSDSRGLTGVPRSAESASK